MVISKLRKFHFYANYVFSKTFFIFWEVKDFPVKIFLAELVYSLGKIFQYHTDFSSSFYKINFYKTRFGDFHIRQNTMDVISSSPAFERPDVIYFQRLVRNFISKNVHITFLDIGADFGAYTVAVANFCKRNKYSDFEVYSFEPTSSSYRLLEKNIKQNDLTDFAIKAFNCGLSNENNNAIPILFNEEDPGSTSIKNIQRHEKVARRQREEIISVKRLDTMVLTGNIVPKRGVLLVKIDVEGYETYVLQGALQMLKNSVYQEVYIMVEDSIDSSVMNYLESEGFSFLTKRTPYNSWWHYKAPVLVPQVIDTTMIASVVVVNWNGKKWLNDCLGSLRRQTVNNFEIIVVDNNSSDGSEEFIKNKFPEVIFVQTGSNLGFAGGNNAALPYAKGKYLILLNNDTWVESDYVEKFTNAFQEIPNLGAAQSKIVLMENQDKLDACGAYWSHSSFLYHYGYAKNSLDSKYNRKFKVFSNKGASMIVRHDLVRTLGLFDEKFWCYYEETDFCHRVWLSGYECWYYPVPVAHHALGGTSINFKNTYVQSHNLKNKIRSYIKNLEKKNLFLVLPVFLILNLGLSLFGAFSGKGFGSIQALFKAIYWNFSNGKETLLERKSIQKMRKVSDKEIFKIARKEPDLAYYYYLLTGLEKYEDKL